MKSCIPLIIATLLLADSAAAMIRTIKYRPLTEVKNNTICVYTRHEHNKKRMNRNHVLNGKDPIVCRLNISGRTGGESSPILQKSVTQYLAYEKLTKSCVQFDLPKGQTVVQFVGLSSECTTAEAAVRVFPEYAAQLREPKAKTKG